MTCAVPDVVAAILILVFLILVQKRSAVATSFHFNEALWWLLACALHG